MGIDKPEAAELPEGVDAIALRDRYPALGIVVLPYSRHEAEVKSATRGFVGVDVAPVAELLNRVDAPNGVQNPELAGVVLGSPCDEAKVAIR